MSASDSNNTDGGTTDVGVDAGFSEEQLRLAAQALDGGSDSVEIGGADQGGSDAPADVEGNQNNNAAHDDAQQGSSDGAGAESAKADGADAEEQKGNDKSKEAVAPPSKYEKARKDAQRYDRNWRKLQERQVELARAQAELAERERALAASGNGAVEGADAAPDVGRNAEDFEAAASDWERAGKFDLAALARKEAQRLRAAPAPVQRQAGAQVAQVVAAAGASSEGPGSRAFIAQWNAHLRELESSSEFADLSDRQSELYRATADVLRSDERFSRFPDGIRLAAQIARMRVESEAVPELRKQLKQQTEELAKLRAATSPSRGVPNSRGAPRSFEALSAAEAEAELLRMAREVDAA